MAGIKIRQLLNYCLDEVKKGNAEKTIFISSDDEWNDFHELFYGFSKPADNYLDKERIIDIERYHKIDDIILLG